MFAFALNAPSASWLYGLIATWWLQSALLIGLGLLAGAIARRLGAATQSVIYRATLCGVLLCPAFMLLMSAIGTKYLLVDLQPISSDVSESAAYSVAPSGGTPLDDQGTLDDTEREDRSTFVNPTDVDRFSSERLDKSSLITSHQTPFRTESQQNAEGAAPKSGSFPASTSVAVDDRTIVPRVIPMAIIGWLAGVLVLFAKMTGEFVNLGRLRFRSGAADGLAEQRCHEIAAQLGVEPPCVRVSPFLSSPCLVGHWSPTVYLPEETPATSYREVFLHELAHLDRSDWLWSVIGRAMRVLLWVQPLAWVLVRKTAISAEEVCDDYVLKYGGNREGYVERLLEIAESRLPRQPIAGVAMVSFQSTLSSRARRILDHSRKLSTSAGSRFAAITLLSMMVASAFIGLLQVGNSRAGETVAEFKPPKAVDEKRDGTSTSPASDPFGGPQQATPEARRLTPDKNAKEIRGRVIDPKGNPVAGARLILERNQDHVHATGFKHEIDVIDESVSSEDGSFTLDPGRNGRVGGTQIVASARGFGLAVDLSFKEGESPTITLPEDVPVEGRILNTEGQPVSGVTVSVLKVIPATSNADVVKWINNRRPELFEESNRRIGFLDDDRLIRATVFPGRGTVHSECSLMPVRSVVSDEKGRFRLSGFGINRRLLLQLAGPSIVHECVHVVTREMPAFKAFHRSDSRLGLVSFTHHGANCNLITRPSQPIVGRIVDAETDDPIVGGRVAITKYGEMRYSSSRGYVFTETDRTGVFRFEDVPTGGGHEVRFLATEKSPYFSTKIELPKTNGSGPQECEMRLTKARWIRGRVTDRDGQGVRAIVQYYPYRSNPAAEKYQNFDPIIAGAAPNSDLKTDAEGNFRIRAIPGRGVLGARVNETGREAKFLSDVSADLIERMGGKRMGKLFNPWTHDWFHVMREIDIAPDQKELNFDLTVTRGQSHTISVQTENGDPIVGVDVLGRVFPPQLEKQQSAKIEVIGLSPDGKRQVVLMHRKRKLGRAFWITSENRLENIRLQPCATLSGRLLDGDKQPVANVSVRVTPMQTQDNWSRILAETKTDSDGAFTVLLPPGVSYRVWHFSGRGPNFDVQVTPEANATYDVGDLRNGDKLDEQEVAGRRTASARAVAEETLVATHEQEAAPLVFEGQVLTPNGKPAAGASIFHTGWVSQQEKFESSKPVTKADTEGQFRFEFTASPQNYQGGIIIANLEGYAVSWAMDSALETTGRLRGELEKRRSWLPAMKALLEHDSGPMRLVPDDVTVSGRLVDLEGRPVQRATVSVEALRTGIDGTLREWEERAASPAGYISTLQNTTPRSLHGTTLAALIPPVETDREGRFEIKGIGKDRIAKVVVRAQNIEAIVSYARTNNGPRRDIARDAGTGYRTRRYDGTELSLVASPAKAIIGKITDAKTGQPLEGITLRSSESYSQTATPNGIVHSRSGSDEVFAVTGTDGSYRLDGLPPGRYTPIHVSSPNGRYIPREIRMDTRGEGIEPIEKNIELSKGILVTGRIVNAKTGKGVSGSFRYLSASRNGLQQFSSRESVGLSNTDGMFRCSVPGDDGYLCFQASEFITYPLVDTPKATGKGVAVLPGYREFNAVKRIVDARARNVLQWNLSLTPLSVITGTAIRADGTQLSNLRYVGRSPQNARWTMSDDGRVEVIGIEPGKSRRIVAYHPRENLVGYLVTNNGLASGFRLRTRPWAVLKGRVLDEDGDPIGGARIYSASGDNQVYASPSDAMMNSDFAKQPLPLPPTDGLGNVQHHTDEKGRFELVGMVPGYSYNLDVAVPRDEPTQNPILFHGVLLKPGETRDLGDVVLQKRR
ncbi:MAG: M56 family metallopeptidase [Planctomycetota bacterium]